MKQAALPSALVMLFVLGGPLARADHAHPRVVLRIDACADISAASVRKIVSVELGALLVGEGERAPDTAEADVRCTSEGAELSVLDPITGKSLHRAVALYTAAANARTRLLALSIAELVSASWVELEINPTPAIPALGLPSTPEARDAARASLRPLLTPASHLSLAAVGAVTGFFSLGALYGGGLQLAYSPRTYAGFAVEVLAEHGSASAEQGSIRVDTISASAMYLLTRSWSRVGVRGGIGLRAGAVDLRGVAFDPTLTRASHVWGAWLGPFGEIGLSVLATRRLVIGLDSDVGVVALPVRALADGHPVASLSGAWLGVQLSLAIYL